MTSTVEQLLALVDTDDPFDYQLSDVRPAQLDAIGERFERARSTMPVLDQRAADASIKQIDAIADIVPLFFSDQTYKSYPASLVAQKRWRTLGSWVDALSTGSGAADVDAESAADLDGWLDTLRAAGHVVYVSSGTSGKCSLFKVNEADRAFDTKVWDMAWRWATGAVPDHELAVFALMPSKGPLRMMDAFGRMVADYGRPDATYFLSDEPLRVTDVNALGVLRQQMAAGTATPADVKNLEDRSKEKTTQMQEGMQRLAEAVVRHQAEPALFIGTWAPQFMLAKAAQALGLTGGVHPDSIVFGGGGLKGIEIAPDYREQIDAILGVDRSKYLLVYGVSELTTMMPACSEGRYHCAPWMIPVVVDEKGERLVEPSDGEVVGRLGLVDLSLDGRWGAILTGDKGTLSLEPCPCGRRSPTVADNVVRYIDLPGGDDRVTCSGTIDAYVRGLLGGGEQ